MAAIRRILTLWRPYRGRLLLSQFLLLVSAVCTLGTAALNEQLINNGLMVGNTSVIIDTGLWMAALGVAAGLALAGVALLAVFFSQGTAYGLRIRTYDQIQQYSFANFDKLRTGNLMVRLNSDITNVANAVLYGVMLLLCAPFMLIIAFLLASWTAPDMVWIIAVVALTVIAVAAVLVPALERAYTQRQDALDAVNNTLQENLSGVRVVKAFNRESLEIERFNQRTEAMRKPAFEAAFRVALLTPILNMLTQLGVAMTLLVGGQKAISGNGSIGQVTSFTQYLSLVVVPLALAAMIIPYVLRGVNSAQRIFEVIDAEPVLSDGGAAALPPGRGARIALEGVRFGFGTDQAAGPDVLHGIDLVIEPGQSVGILGATGSGKSALVNLIPRFHDVRAGRVTLDGVDVRDLPLSELRASVGIALQEAVLFQGDIRTNLKFAAPDAPDSRMFAAAQTADAFNFISALPQSWEAPVARRGYNFSGGQRQRMSMTRTLVPAPRVVILDDSTSALDVATETRVQNAIPTDCAGATVIYVAQRISAVIDLDRIVVMEAGRIVASGTHEELMQTSQLYQQIYQSQLGAQAEAGTGSSKEGSA